MTAKDHFTPLKNAMMPANNAIGNAVNTATCCGEKFFAESIYILLVFPAEEV